MGDLIPQLAPSHLRVVQEKPARTGAGAIFSPCIIPNVNAPLQDTPDTLLLSF